ncbi:MAG: hypothetical protein SGBAC_007202 [Bacillariaceae sp.]
MKGISVNHITAIVFAAVLGITRTGVESFPYAQQTSSYRSKQSSEWNNYLLVPRNIHGIDHFWEQASTSPRSNSCLYAAKGTDDKTSAKKPGMAGYNDDAFGLIFLTGGVLSQDADFVVTFVALSAIAAIVSSSFVEFDERLPGLVALATLLVTPLAAYLHATIVDGGGGIWAAPQPVEIGLCLVSLAWAFAKWSQEGNE